MLLMLFWAKFSKKNDFLIKIIKSKKNKNNKGKNRVI